MMRPDSSSAADTSHPTMASGYVPLDAPLLVPVQQAASTAQAQPLPLPRRRGIARRLSRLSMMATALALVTMGLVLNAAVYISERQALQDHADALARVAASQVLAPLRLNNPTEAARTLDSLRHSPHVTRATLYDEQRVAVADFRDMRAEPGAPAEPAPALDEPGKRIAGHQIVVVEPVADALGVAGWLRLQLPLQPLYRSAGILGAISTGTAALAMLLVWWLAGRARRQVARIEQQLDNLTYRDPVTQLYNRHAAAEHLEEYVRQAQQSSQGFSIVSFDLNNFKTINGTLGHHIGDKVLRETARRLEANLLPGARAYRFGGDEFVTICPCARGLQAPESYGQIIRQALSGVLRIEGYEISLSGSVGVARYPQDGERAEDVLLAADMAMYRAKLRGKNALAVFGSDLREASQARLRIESDLRRALRDQELRLLYQPIVDLRSGAVVGAEALVRWQHPVRGLLGPAEFVAVAEQSGLIVPLGAWVLGEAARQLARWHEQGLVSLRLAVNVSARQLRGRRLLEQIMQAVAPTGCELQSLGLEIELTEHTLVEDLAENLQLLMELREVGIRIAVDDFGTGLSSLAYLKRLPIHKLKIDRSFIKGLADDASDAAIVGAAVSMGHALGLQVVAEGVETPAQRDALVAMGCDLGQGWLFGKPIESNAFAKLARNSLAADAQRRHGLTA